MDLDKFQSLSVKEQEEFINMCQSLMKKHTEPHKTPPSSPTQVKRELDSPDTPYHGGSKKIRLP
jgi:hypothetical protein